VTILGGTRFYVSTGAVRTSGASCPGLIYFKPGFGVDPDADNGDRDWTFEVGFRWFLD